MTTISDNMFNIRNRKYPYKLNIETTIATIKSRVHLSGELLSFYLSRMLGFDNIPIVVLSEVNTTSPQWRGQELQRAGWEEGKLVALIEWIEGLHEER